MVVEPVTNEFYRAVRGRPVFAPAGLAAPEPVEFTDAFLPWGGWMMRADDYAALHARWFGPDFDPYAQPDVEVEVGAVERALDGTAPSEHV